MVQERSLANRRRPPCRRHAQLACLALAACATTPAPTHPRPTLPLPPAIAAEFALPGPVTTGAWFAAGGDHDRIYWRGALHCAGEVATFHVLQPRTAAPRPLVICLPILAGGAELMWLVASGLADRGFAAAWVDRAAAALRGEQRGPELDALFRRTVRQNRMLLRWSERRSDLFAPGRRGMLGLSTGGILGTVLLALEPGIAAGALCLAGADVPSLLLESEESRVVQWRTWRAEADGLAGQALLRELERELTVDPARFGAYVDTRRVLLVHAGHDSVVPERQHRLLWETLGRPQDLRLQHLGHYTAALALDAVLDAVAEFCGARLAAVAGA